MIKKITLLNFKFFVVDYVYNPITKWYKEAQFKKKISKILEKRPLKNLTTSQQSEIKTFYKKLGIGKINTSWHKFYYCNNGHFSAAYVPENIFYLYIEPKLNNEIYTSALSDKNLLDRLFIDIKQPETIFKNMNGFLYHQNELIEITEAIEMCNSAGTLFIKPTTDTRGGQNVSAFSCENGIINHQEKKVKELFAIYEKNYIVQKKVQQHESMIVLNPTSLNTFRVMSYLHEKEVTIISTIVRIGREGSITDNMATGGISCGVQNDGSLNKVGFLSTGERILTTDSGVKFAETKLPFVEKMKLIVKKLHKTSPFFKIISWDLALDNIGDVVLIEYNVNSQGINSHQLSNGPVLSPLLYEIYKNK